ncbi:GtrA family protein [Rhodoferax sp.]|uniref:GtrA family protein n=1 Tax=Rhodoferax sp. TaxID=50421 RepID=UPI003BB6EC16
MALIDPRCVVVSNTRFSKFNFWRELLIAARFGFVGIFSTSIHIMTVWLLLDESRMTPISANTLAFLIAFGFSFGGNYLWTFRSPGSPRRAIFRFFLIAASAFAANTLILAFLVHEGWFSPVVSAVLSASVVPVISFSASRFWCFSAKK